MKHISVGEIHCNKNVSVYLGGGWRSGHLQAKHSHLEGQMSVFWVLCQHSAEEGTFTQGGRGQAGQVVGGWIDLLAFAFAGGRREIHHQVGRVSQQLMGQLYS